MKWRPLRRLRRQLRKQAPPRSGFTGLGETRIIAACYGFAITLAQADFALRTFTAFPMCSAARVRKQLHDLFSGVQGNPPRDAFGDPGPDTLKELFS